MVRLTFSILIILSFFSCQKNIGGFQKSSRENFTQSKQPIPLKSQIIFEIPLEIEDQSQLNEELSASEIPIISFDNSSQGFKKMAMNNSEIKTSEPPKFQEFTIKQTSPKNTFYKKDIRLLKSLKRNPVFNDSLKIGIVFLAIALGLSFLPVLQLTLLFAIVAMIFLFIGLKKLFKRRAKMKQIRLRKERNELRKEKIKDIFRQ